MPNGFRDPERMVFVGGIGALGERIHEGGDRRIGKLQGKFTRSVLRHTWLVSRRSTATLRIATFQIITDLVRLDFLLAEDLAHRSLRQIG
jgi:hypothetical protein